MASENESHLFRKSALNHMRSADDLDAVLSVSNPSMWITILAFFALVVGLVTWSVLAVVPVTTATVAITDGAHNATLWVDADMARQLSSPQARVSIAGKEATSVAIESRPRASAEVIDSLKGSYLADGLDLEPWNYQVSLVFDKSLYEPGEVDGEDAILAPAQIVTREEHPIALVFGR